MRLHQARVRRMDGDAADMARGHAAADGDALGLAPVGPFQEELDHLGQALAELDRHVTDRALLISVAVLEPPVDVAFGHLPPGLDAGFAAMLQEKLDEGATADTVA